MALPGSISTFPDTDPDPTKWYGSDRIRIRNTGYKIDRHLLIFFYPRWCCKFNWSYSKNVLSTLYMLEMIFIHLFPFHKLFWQLTNLPCVGNFLDVLYCWTRLYHTSFSTDDKVNIHKQWTPWKICFKNEQGTR